ncbi:MAG: ABC transporter substrate-binding protein, partial [Pseudomonadota bacterium]
MNRYTTPLALALMASTAMVSLANAETLRWARAGDSLTLDPHAQNEGPTHTLAHQIYEPLLQRDMSGEIIPALATEWGVTDDPTVWEFKIREGVTFHEGQELTAEDVVFSFERALKPTSAMKELLNSIESIEAVDDYTVQFTTKGPNPLLPVNFTNLFVMDSGWAEENDVLDPQDIANGETNFAATNANGTGAYQVTSRESDAQTVLTANPNYWGIGEFPLEVSEIIFTPIQSPATRVAALLSGEVDFIQDVPVQDLDRVDSDAALKVVKAPQNRTIFFGMNVAADDLDSDDVDGENPFSKLEVRQAMNLALNREAIQQVV